MLWIPSRRSPSLEEILPVRRHASHMFTYVIALISAPGNLNLENNFLSNLQTVLASLVGRA